MRTKKTTELSSFQEHEHADGLGRKLNEIEELLAIERSTGEEKKATRDARDSILRQYQAARIAADRPRQA